MSHIANFISCIKVGVKCSKTQVYYAKGPKFLINLIKIIYDEGLIHRYTVVYHPVLIISIFLKPNIIKDIRVVSTPGRKVYISVYQLRSFAYKNPRSLYVISTSHHGIISSNTALERNVGGEILCIIKF